MVQLLSPGARTQVKPHLRVNCASSSTTQARRVGWFSQGLPKYLLRAGIYAELSAWSFGHALIEGRISAAAAHTGTAPHGHSAMPCLMGRFHLGTPPSLLWLGMAPGHALIEGGLLGLRCAVFAVTRTVLWLCPH